jgi:uncharacterized damage-inducible protein DinB
MSSELDLIRELYAYNSLVRKKYLAAIWRLPAKKRNRARGASFPSLADIFLHVLDAYRWWFLSCVAGDTSWHDYPVGLQLSQAEARREERKTDRLVMGLVNKLRPRDLSRTYRIAGENPKGERISMRTLLLHMLEEELQHRGEMNALLWQEDVDPPVTGFDEV